MEAAEAPDWTEHDAAQRAVREVAQPCEDPAKGGRMTLREFYDEAERLLPGGTFFVEVKVWNYRRENQSIAVSWTIWDHRRREHNSGPTPEAALDALRAAVVPTLAADVPPLTTVGIPLLVELDEEAPSKEG